jgi:O-antigen/teichoic acid export membrane protein
MINTAGALAPVAVTLVSVPVYLHVIGQARYGLLAIVWVLLGYFGLFDFGLGRATANAVAKLRGTGDDQPYDATVWTAVVTNGAVGVIWAGLVFGVSRLLIGDVLKIPTQFRHEALTALPLLACVIPLMTMSLVFAGALEGQERFFIVNLLQTAGAVLTQLLPLGAAILIGPSMTVVLASVAIALTVSTLATFAACVRFMPLDPVPRLDRALVGHLLRYGGWVTVSGIVSPILSAVDRLVIGAIVGARSVASYAIAANFVTRLSIPAGSLARALFPRLSMETDAAARNAGDEAAAGLLAIVTPMVVTALVLVRPFFTVWLGGDIAQAAGRVSEIMLLGIWLNSLAFIPYVFLLARGRPDVPAKLHVAELPPYLLALWVGLKAGGIDGAAIAWTIRVAADSLLLFFFARLNSRALATNAAVGAALVAAACIGALTFFSVPLLRTVVGGGLLVVSVWWAWRVAPDSIHIVTRRLAVRGVALLQSSTR